MIKTYSIVNSLLRKSFCIYLSNTAVEHIPRGGLLGQRFFAFIIFFLKFILFIYFWLWWVFVAVRRLSLVVANGGYSSCGARASHCGGFSCCGAWALGTRASVVVARGL